MESGGASPLPSFPATPRTTTPSNLNPSVPRRTKICVFCGASPGHDPAHLEAARALARALAANNIALVYGGGTVGLMGEIAKTLVSLSGPESVHGIIPEALGKKKARGGKKGLKLTVCMPVKYERDPTYTSTQLAGEAENGLAVPEETLYGKTTVVKDMHTRKMMMAQEVVAGGPGSGFIALSGGYGTVEELLETATWNQLGIHNKGICILNINGFYDGILDWIRKSAQEGFIKGGNGSIVAQATNAEDAIKALREYRVSPSVLKLAWGNE